MTDDDQGLLADLRGMWQRRDPVPPGLVDSVIVALSTRDLGAEYELLTLVDSTDRLAGVRGGSDTRTLTFAAGPATVMLRVSALPDGRRRVDGWVAPPSRLAVRLRCGADDLRTTSTDAGRFELTGVRAGVATLRLEPLPAPPAAPGTTSGVVGDPAPPGALRLETPPFEL